MPGSARTIYTDDDTGGWRFIARSESDAEHYSERTERTYPPGGVHPDTESFIAGYEPD
jgi:hypothetical protein